MNDSKDLGGKDIYKPPTSIGVDSGILLTATTCASLSTLARGS